MEALVVRNLIKNPKLAKSIADAAWSSFFAQLLESCGRGWPSSGASESGLYVANLFGLRTSPRDASLGAGLRVLCVWSGIDRDYNGSKNILDEALEAVGRHGCVIPEALGTGAVGSRHENSERHSMTW